MKKSWKKIPRFKTWDEEFKFWAKHDATEFIDMAKSERIELPDLKPTTKKISIDLPAYLIAQLKMMAHKKGMPYQSLMKFMIAKELTREINLTRS